MPTDKRIWVDDSDDDTAAVRARHPDLPEHCECGGTMEYSESCGRVFSACSQCTPVVKVDLSGLYPGRKA